MATLTVQGSGVTDTLISGGSPTTNFGTATEMASGKFSTDVNRILVKFDISSIPSGSTITSAIITLTYSSDNSLNARTGSVYRVKRAWVEAQATWNIYSTGNNWGTAGCADTTNDREATDIGTWTHPASPTLGTSVDITLTASSVQEMISGGSFTNNGFLLQVATEVDDQISYDSTNSADTTERPKLVIIYTAPITANQSYAYFM